MTQHRATRRTISIGSGYKDAVGGLSNIMARFDSETFSKLITFAKTNDLSASAAINRLVAEKLGVRNDS